MGLRPYIDGKGKEWGEEACRNNGEKGVGKTGSGVVRNYRYCILEALTLTLSYPL